MSIASTDTRSVGGNCSHGRRDRGITEKQKSKVQSPMSKVTQTVLIPSPGRRSSRLGRQQEILPGDLTTDYRLSCNGFGFSLLRGAQKVYSSARRSLARRLCLQSDPKGLQSVVCSLSWGPGSTRFSVAGRTSTTAGRCWDSAINRGWQPETRTNPRQGGRLII